MDCLDVLRKNLKDVMSQRGINQVQLSEKTGITTATISRYITGVHNPKIDYIAKMAESMDVSIDYLMGLSSSSIPDAPPSTEILTLISSYERADPRTKKMVWMQLELVMTDAEKEFVFQLSSEHTESKSQDKE